MITAGRFCRKRVLYTCPIKGDRQAALAKVATREDEVDTTVASSFAFCRRDVEVRTCKLNSEVASSFLKARCASRVKSQNQA
jgi:hypothetical protein